MMSCKMQVTEMLMSRGMREYASSHEESESIGNQRKEGDGVGLVTPK